MNDDLINRYAAVNLLIDAENAVQRFKPFSRDEQKMYNEFTKAEIAIGKLPAVQPEVRSGKWVHDHETGLDYCTACNGEPSDWWWSPYCPNCGADMREVEHETD